MQQRKIYILLTDTGSIFTKAIKRYTRAPYNHSSLALDEELIQLYSFGRKNPNNPLNGGFVHEDVLNGTYRNFPNTTCAVYEISVTDRQYHKINRLISVFKQNDRKMLYNLLGVFGVALKEPFEPIGSYFCSQFVADILHRSDIKLWNKLPALVEPNDFRESNQTTLIYEGPLSLYPPLQKRKHLP
ncbi:hypothetical protein [Jeotgalibacillus proteolyticus]|uniref:Uncharacterized protein n=1 Tax=Jeotgalibacillus proteolyticus TaxID=2082395 RepID=A0A2S5G695_9BACL|nr:hypothetical protein [Jeotgalibacillus proteolyticus]PPA68463.1 hypothetical protein C4B60_20685 [Jeotgalibacillus proteolyticus]